MDAHSLHLELLFHHSPLSAPHCSFPAARAEKQLYALISPLGGKPVQAGNQHVGC